MNGQSGIGTINIAGIGREITLTKCEKIKLMKNGIPAETNRIKIRYGNLFIDGNILFGIQPMAVEGQ